MSLHLLTCVIFYTSREYNCLKPESYVNELLRFPRIFLEMFDQYSYRLDTFVSVLNMNKVNGSGEMQEKMSDYYKTHNLPIRFECPGNEI